jgi:hypothetical protein
MDPSRLANRNSNKRELPASPRIGRMFTTAGWIEMDSKSGVDKEKSVCCLLVVSKDGAGLWMLQDDLFFRIV